MRGAAAWKPDTAEKETHLHGTWPGGTAQPSCSQLQGGHHRLSWGRRGLAVPLGLLSSTSCRSEESHRSVCVSPRSCPVPLGRPSLQAIHSLHTGWVSQCAGTCPGQSQTYLVSLLCIIVVRKGGFIFRVFADFSLLQIKLPFSFKVKPVLLVL